MKKRIFALLLATMVLVGLFAATGGAESADPVWKICFSCKTLVNEPFISYQENAIKEKVAAMGHEYVLMSTDSAQDIAQQVSQIEDMINAGVNAIIINPLDATALTPVLEKCEAAGIPVAFVDTPPVEEQEDLYLTFIGTDNYAASVLAGEAMVEQLGGEGKIVLVRGTNGNTCDEQRSSGFKKGIEGSNLQIVAEQAGNFTSDDSMQAMENMLIGNPDIDGVFLISDTMVTGALQAIENNPNVNLEDLTIISFDGNSIGAGLVRDGKIYGDMAQYPGQMGEIAVETLVGVLNGDVDPASVDKFIETDTFVITSENVEKAFEECVY